MTIRKGLPRYALITGSLAVTGLTVGWVTNPDRGTIAVPERPMASDVRQPAEEPAWIAAATIAELSRAAPVSDKAPARVIPRSLDAGQQRLEVPASRYRVVKVTRGPHGPR